MSVQINEAGLRQFFAFSPRGIHDQIEQQGELLREIAQRNVESILWRREVDGIIGVQMRLGEEGVEAVVGVVNQGSLAEYLDHKALEPKEGTESWMLRSMLEAFSG